ncbi:hypothetical protein JDF658_21610 [Carboxydocella sp. JDF658]|nr:hypothetical protein ULO1_10990 [Carboxydocella sp. ULO1]GAW32396.1 hypothetical protein JDF658_21610 [Carboxydocella sp. JDF658]
MAGGAFEQKKIAVIARNKVGLSNQMGSSVAICGIKAPGRTGYLNYPVKKGAFSDIVVTLRTIMAEQTGILYRAGP